MLPTFLEALGLLPDPRDTVRPDRGVFVHFRRVGGKLLLHALAVAHPGGRLRGVPAAARGEEQGGVGLEQGLELELETSGLWVHALSKQQGRTVRCHIDGAETLKRR